MKAFGTMAAAELEQMTTADGKKVALLHVGEDAPTEARVAGLINRGGWEAVKVGGLDQLARIEVFGDLHPFGGLNGELPSKRMITELLHR